MNAAYVEDLEKLAKQGCSVPGCTHADHSTVYFHGRCHMQAPVQVSYTKDSGELVITCYQCKHIIAKVAVARSTPQTGGN